MSEKLEKIKKQLIESRAPIGIFSHYAGAKIRNSTDELIKGVHEIKGISESLKRCTASQRAGHVAEAYHACTFNADAALKGSKLRAHTTRSLKDFSSPADVVVKSGSKTVLKAQVKYHKTAIRNSGALSDPKYDSMERIVPKEQLKSVQRTSKVGAAKALAKGNIKKAKARLEVSNKASASVKHKNVKSKPLTIKGAKRLSRNPDSLVSKAIASELTSAATTGAISGTAFEALKSGAINYNQYRKGKISAKEAFKRTGQASVKAGASGATIATLGAASARFIAKAGAKKIAKGSAPGVIAQLGFEVASDVLQVYQGKVTYGEALCSAGKKGALAAGSMAGSELGAVVGTMILPGIGTVVGAALGGFICSQTVQYIVS